MRSKTGPECLSENSVVAFVGGLLSERDVTRIDEHLATCTDCLWLVTAAAVGTSGEVENDRQPLPVPVPARQAAQRFERRHELARGGMGSVFYGVDRETGSAVAIKRIRSDLAHWAPALLGRFLREMEILRLLDHPNIVKLISSAPDGDEQQIVMEYMGGGSLRTLLAAEKTLPIARTVAVGLELTDALARAHHLGVVHRDIKPGNVLLTENGTPKLADFGLSMLVGHESSTSNGVLGTMAYASPEALSGQASDARSDLWSLGVLLFEMVTGQRPFAGDTPAALVSSVLHRPTPDLEALRPDAPVQFVDLVYRLLEKNRDERLGSARHLGAELEALSRPPAERRLVVSGTRLAGVSIGSVPARLPAQTTPFIGRLEELARLARMLSSPQVRAVTIVGIGGMGKSRLAIELARQVESASGFFAAPAGAPEPPLRRVCFVDLAPLTSPDLIVPAVAESVGYQFKPDGDPKGQLLDFFREKRLLLVLDNVEHLIAGTGFITELLSVAAGVKVLATSREPLGWAGEVQVPLSGMPVPEQPSADAALELGAVQLFVDSARRIRFGFQPSQAEAGDIVRICRLVHGMPLGIVLAASWVNALSLREVGSEIEKSLDFLRLESGHVPRQQSMRALFDHSWALLKGPEQSTLAAASVFRGGFTRAAVEAVGHASLSTLASLVAKSLLRRVAETGRYEIHELLRQYAEAKLRADGAEHDRVVDRLAAYYSAFLSEKNDEILCPRRGAAFNEIQTELENIRIALHWMMKHRQAARVWPTLHTLGVFYHSRRARSEAEAVFVELTDAFEGPRGEALRDERRALGLALIYRALLTEEQGRKEVAAELAARSVAELAQTDRDRHYAVGLTLCASIATGAGKSEESVALLEEGIAVSRELGEDWWLARALTVSCRVYIRAAGDLAKAEACMLESVALQKRLGQGTIPFADTLGVLGMIRYSRGYQREGCELVLESLKIAEDLNDRWAIVLDLQFAARAHRALGDYAAAEAYVRRCIELALDLGHSETVVWCQLTLGSILRLQCRFAEAAVALAAGAKPGQRDPALLAKAELGLGEVALDQRDFQRAEQHLSRSLALCEEQRASGGTRAALEALGYLAMAEGRYDAARAHFRRAFEIARRRQRPTELLGLVLGAAALCAKTGELDRAAELVSLALHHPATSRPLHTLRVEPLRAELDALLGADPLGAALARGPTLSLDGIIESGLFGTVAGVRDS